MRGVKLFLAALTVLMTPVMSLAVPAPKVSIATLSELPVVERAPYDETANANAAVDAAFARAKKSHKRVFIDMGGNWCGDCIVLSNFMRLPEIDAFVRAHYEVAVINVGRFDKNLQVPARFGIKTRLEGVPAVIIATPNGVFVNAGHVAALADARSMSPQDIANWIAQWAQ